MALHEVTFQSFNGRDTVYGWIYTPVHDPIAVVQLVHGLGEHSRRYRQLIAALLDAGIAVAMNDHVGHGKTGMESGIWQDTGETGWQTYINDEYSLTRIVRDVLPDTPFYMFGHSWGSMIARAYAGQHANGLNGLILCGVVEHMRGLDEFDFEALDADVVRTGGAEPAGERAAQIFLGANDRFGAGAAPTAWIATDAHIVADHAADPFNNFSAQMSLRFLRDFVGLYREVTDPALIEKFPLDLPVLLLAGDQDPCGNFGEGTYHTANKMWARGMRDIRTRVYTDLRHEVHNEPESRADVEDEIASFIVLHSIQEMPFTPVAPFRN